MTDVTTITGEVEDRKQEWQEKAHADKLSLKIDGVWVSMLKPKQEAIDQGWDKGVAWKVAEVVEVGQWVKCGHEGQYKNIVSLEIIERPAVPKPVSGDLRNQWIIYQALMKAAVVQVNHTYYAAIEEPHKEAWKITRDWIRWFPAAFKEAE